MTGRKSQIREHPLRVALLAALLVGAISAAGIFTMTPRGSTPNNNTPQVLLCPVAPTPGGSFRLQMNTATAYCDYIEPPTGSSTRFVWQTVSGNVTFVVWEVCLPSAGCITGIAGDEIVYNSTGSIGFGNLSNSRGLSFEFSIASASSSSGSAQGPSNETGIAVLVAGSWN
jgi:hypothetical protein